MTEPTVNPRKRDFVEKSEFQRQCPHLETEVIREGITRLLGRVVCLKCGAEREWEAY